MTQIEVGCELIYQVPVQTVFLFQIEAARTQHQQVLTSNLYTNPQVTIENCQVGEDIHQMQRMVVDPCQLQVSYQATVGLSPEVDRPEQLDEWNASQLPVDVLKFLNPSRYCESDLLGRFAFQEFGQMQRGYGRVQAICDWVHGHLEYVSGSTNSSTTARDVLVQRTGVCRDFAHLAISLCRGVGIPARYVAGYAVDLQPPDFHGFMEAYLQGTWYLFDPTQLAAVAGLVRIGTGLDAADVSFATLTGNAVLLEKNVWANACSGNNTTTTNQPVAVSTA